MSGLQSVVDWNEDLLIQTYLDMKAEEKARAAAGSTSSPRMPVGDAPSPAVTPSVRVTGPRRDYQSLALAVATVVYLPLVVAGLASWLRRRLAFGGLGK